MSPNYMLPETMRVVNPGTLCGKRSYIYASLIQAKSSLIFLSRSYHEKLDTAYPLNGSILCFCPLLTVNGTSAVPFLRQSSLAALAQQFVPMPAITGTNYFGQNCRHQLELRTKQTVFLCLRRTAVGFWTLWQRANSIAGPIKCLSHSGFLEVLVSSDRSWSFGIAPQPFQSRQ